jgi:hypothetical protein
MSAEITVVASYLGFTNQALHPVGFIENKIVQAGISRISDNSKLFNVMSIEINVET